MNKQDYEYLRLINKSEDYIENNLSQKITLDDLSNNINISKYHFHRIFKKYNKENINQYISRIKIERSAIYLVINKNITITTTSYQYGYCDTSSYCKAFKRYFKVSPKVFIKQYNTIINNNTKL